MFDVIKEMSQDSFGRGMLCASLVGFMGLFLHPLLPIDIGYAWILPGYGVLILTLICDALGIIK